MYYICLAKSELTIFTETADAVPEHCTFHRVSSRSTSDRLVMKTGRGGSRFMADSGCQWCPTSTHPSARWAGTCDSHLDTSQNDGLGGCRGNPEEISHTEWGGPRDLHDCVQEPLGSGKQVHLLTSFMSNLLLYPPLDMPITTGFLSCVSLHLSTLSYFPYNGWQTASVRVCMCVCFTDPDFGS